MNAKITMLPGDGVGPEVAAQAQHVLEFIADAFGHTFTFEHALIGGCAIDETSSPMPDETLEACRHADAVFLGAVGGPKWSDPNAPVRPEQGLLALRRELGVFANLRPVKPIDALLDQSPIKPAIVRGTDVMVVRELTGGIYFGDKSRTETSATDICTYTTPEIERIIRVACELSTSRQGRLVSVDKANVLETSRLWRSTTERVVRDEFPEIELEHMLVDAAAMHLISRPSTFDVMVTENMFGDILTDEASMLAGSMGLLPSASLGEGVGLYEPIHGSAPDVAGKGVANPTGAILSAAMLLRHSLHLETEATAVEAAVTATIEAGTRTIDITESSPCSTAQFGAAVARAIASAAPIAS